jgi:hypothetical protein
MSSGRLRPPFSFDRVAVAQHELGHAHLVDLLALGAPLRPLRQRALQLRRQRHRLEIAHARILRRQRLHRAVGEQPRVLDLDEHRLAVTDEPEVLRGLVDDANGPVEAEDDAPIDRLRSAERAHFSGDVHELAVRLRRQARQVDGAAGQLAQPAAQDAPRRAIAGDVAARREHRDAFAEHEDVHVRHDAEQDDAAEEPAPQPARDHPANGAIRRRQPVEIVLGEMGSLHAYRRPMPS